MLIDRLCGEREGMMFRQFYNTAFQLESINGVAGGRSLIPVGDPVCLHTRNQKRHCNTKKKDVLIEGVKAQEQPPRRGNLAPLEERG